MTFELTPETLADVERIVSAWEKTACSRETGAKFRAVMDALDTAKAEAWDEGAGAVLDGGYVTKFDGTRLPNATNPYRREENPDG